ncbi:MAG: SAM-dependent methyltransferase, partial [Muribaculaceae bacterium]|nr:SAM-dependent methyltransferase [Muribaculaceae bacterium]
SILCDALTDKRLKRPRIYILNDDFFSIDLSKISEKIFSNDWTIGIIGNPPWVTNSHQGKYDSDNTPLKSNIYDLKGIDAITGKSNFDISEYITLSLLEQFGSCNGGISFLLKNSVIRNIIYKQSKYPKSIDNINQFEIDAYKEFDVSVEASCLTAKLGNVGALECKVFNFYDKKNIYSYGWVNDSFVSDLDSYQRFAMYDGHSSYEWRSGIKHDCAAALELRLIDGKFVNGFGEDVDVESDLIYPLLKSSDINKICENPRKFIIVPQHKTGENTSSLKLKYPKLYEYLESKAEIFAKRKSSIYKGKDRFSIFGVGDYTFKPFKVVVSSLYKDITFTLVKDFQGKPYVVDDTCYQLAFDSLEEAQAIWDALMSFEIQSLLKSLVFKDAKRVVTKSLLMRLDLDKYCESKNISVRKFKESHNSSVIQLSFFD